jgi:hypothetical protein
MNPSATSYQLPVLSRVLTVIVATSLVIASVLKFFAPQSPVKPGVFLREFQVLTSKSTLRCVAIGEVVE